MVEYLRYAPQYSPGLWLELAARCILVHSSEPSLANTDASRPETIIGKTQVEYSCLEEVKVR